MPSPILKSFEYGHLPHPLQLVSQPFHAPARRIERIPDGPEKSAGPRKLLESKDCVVRAALDHSASTLGKGLGTRGRTPDSGL